MLKENISVIDSINNFSILKKEITSVLEKEKVNNLSEILTKDFTYSEVSDYYQKVVDFIKNNNFQNPKLRELLTKLNKLKTISQEEISKTNERFATTQKDFNVFYNKLAKGEKISSEDGRFYETLLRSEYKRFNPNGQNYLKDLQELAKKLKINTKQSSQELLKQINQKLPEYNPELKIIAPETKYSQHDFITKAIELNVPEQTLVDLRENLSRTTTIQEETINNIKQEIKEIEITVKEAFKKKEYTQLFEKYPELKRMKKGIEKGGVPAENLINFIFKNKEIPSEMITDIIKNVFKSEYPEVFEKFVTNSMNTNIKNQFLTRCKELDITLEDYLLNNGLTGIFNKIKASDTYQKIVETRKAVSEIETKSKGITSNLEITFSEHRELLDAFSGVFSGTCFGDYPYDMLRKELFMEKVFKDGRFVGGLTNIIREVEGKKTLVIVGVDVSEAFVSGLSLSKKQELIDLMIDRQKEFCVKNNLNIAISPMGGISNRDGFVKYVTEKYISNKKHNIKKIKIQPTQNYETTNCFDLK